MRALSLALALLWTGFGRQALADEGESSVSASLGYASFAIPEHDPRGSALALDYERGITEFVWLRATAGAGAYVDNTCREEGDRCAAYSGHGTVGITYVLDILRWVPYANLGAGGMVTRTASSPSELQMGRAPHAVDYFPLIEIGGGVDYLYSRNVSYGLQARFESFLDETAFFSAGARISYRWGFF